MLTYHLAFRATSGPGEALLQPLLDPEPPCTLSGIETHLIYMCTGFVPNEITAIAISVNPAMDNLTAIAEPGALHFFRWADATVRPLPARTVNMTYQPGDTYVAVTPAAAQLANASQGGPSATIARFIHLRDYFNADKLAAALLDHLLLMGQSNAEQNTAGVGVLVVEAR